VIAIDGLDDPRVADYRLLATPHVLSRRGLFVAEGRMVVARLLQAPRIRTQSLLVTPTAWRALAPHVPAARRDVPVYLVAQALMNDLTGFALHRGCLAMAERPVVPLLRADALPGPRLLVLEGVNNPDNIGGLFRNAAAFGVDLVVLGPACGDPLYRKAVRTSMGATLHVPFAQAGAWPDALLRLRTAGVHLVALTPAASATTLEHVPRRAAPRALLLGNEGMGLSDAALAAADVRVRIAMRGNVGSLNVATAAAVALYHFSEPSPDGAGQVD
jgi:tRNA G18 (ribose-2'-O)-methylase SpoU